MKVRLNVSRMSAFERKTLRKIYGPIKGKEEWRIRYNKAVQIAGSYNIFKISRLRWAGHVERMSMRIFLRELWIASHEEEVLEDLNLDGSLEYWRI